MADSGVPPAAAGTGRIGVDVGGTFTDVVRHDSSGNLVVFKIPSTPPDFDRAVVDGCAALDTGAVRITAIVHGTTVATNAVLQRRGSRTAFVTTRGFRDVLELRRLRVPALYDPDWRKPPSIVPRRYCFEIDERVTATGTVVRPLDTAQARALARTIADLGITSVAVCFIHSHLHPGHEQAFAEVMTAECPQVRVTLSSELLREAGEYERGATAAVNAYVRPLMQEYLGRIETGLADRGIEAPLTIMQSSGGLMAAGAAAQAPVFALESGPAAGVIAAQGLSARLGYRNVLAFDMGGTTAKASLIENGELARGREYEAGGSMSAGSRLRRGGGEVLRIPTIDLAEVGAGGGSIAALDTAGVLQVTGLSAGARPGPACYGRGGIEATVTDANARLGFLPAGPIADGSVTISIAQADVALAGLAKPMGATTREVALGIHELANARMMRALRGVSSERGRDPRDFVMLAYGGSGPIHAAGLADELSIDTVLVPPFAGLFSATGLLFARPEVHAVRSCYLDAAAATGREVEELLVDMRTDLGKVIAPWAESAAVEWRASADLRYVGQSSDLEISLDVSLASGFQERLVVEFEAEYLRRYGVQGTDDSRIQIRAVRLVAIGTRPDIEQLRPEHRTPATTAAAESREACFGAEVRATKVIARSSLSPGRPQPGPLLIDEYDTTVVVPPGWSVEREPTTDTLLLTRGTGGERH